MWKSRAWLKSTPCATWWMRSAKVRRRERQFPPRGSSRRAGNRFCRKSPPTRKYWPWRGTTESDEAFLYALFQLAQIFASDRFHMRVSGLEKLPATGSYIISSNHQSFLDPILMASVLPWPVFRNLFAVGTSEIFGSGFMRRLARWLRVIVVDPDANLIPAMRAGAFGLRHGRSPDSLSGRRAQHRRNAPDFQEGRGHSFHPSAGADCSRGD